MQQNVLHGARHNAKAVWLNRMRNDGRRTYPLRQHFGRRQGQHVYDPVPQRAEIAASLAGGAKIYESLKELVTAPDVGALTIASPNFLHADQLTQISALRTLPILCEKPLYVNQAQEPAIRVMGSRER